MDTLPATNPTKAEPVPVSIQLKPECNRAFTPDEAMAWARKALGVDHCKFARTWKDSTRGQRLAILNMIPPKYIEAGRAIGFTQYEWVELPVKVQAGYKDVLQRFAKWVAERGLAS